MKSRNFILAVLVFAVLITPTLFGQVDYATATLRGTVMDQAGAVVAGATITATNTSTGISKVVKTGPDGAYWPLGVAARPLSGHHGRHRLQGSLQSPGAYRGPEHQPMTSI